VFIERNCRGYIYQSVEIAPKTRKSSLNPHSTDTPSQLSQTRLLASSCEGIIRHYQWLHKSVRRPLLLSTSFKYRSTPFQSLEIKIAGYFNTLHPGSWKRRQLLAEILNANQESYLVHIIRVVFKKEKKNYVKYKNVSTCGPFSVSK
jgi:hypothetical protein